MAKHVRLFGVSADKKGVLLFKPEQYAIVLAFMVALSQE